MRRAASRLRRRPAGRRSSLRAARRIPGRAAAPGRIRGCSGSCSGTFSLVCSSGGCSGFCSCPDWLPPVPVSCVSGAAASVPPSPSPKLSRRTGWIFSLSDRVFRLLPLHLQRREHDRRKQRRRQHHAEQNTEPAYRPKLSHRASQCKTKTPDPQTDPVFAVPTEDSNSPDLRSGRLSARVLLLPSHGFPQWLPFGPALSRFGRPSLRTVLSSRSIPFSPPLPNTPARRSYKSSVCYFFRLYHTAGAGKKSTVFCVSFRGEWALGAHRKPAPVMRRMTGAGWGYRLCRFLGHVHEHLLLPLRGSQCPSG